MIIRTLDSKEEMSLVAADLIVRRLEENPSLLLCAATGNTPTETYRLLKEASGKRPGLCAALRVIKLDEWGGVKSNGPGTCESYLQTHLVGPLGIETNRYISFNSAPPDPLGECNRIQQLLNTAGPIHICLLGLGMNGHLALNEPGDYLESSVHVVKLTDSSLDHSMVSQMPEKPAYGLTLGMGDILQSEMILLLISGPSKKKVTSEFLSGRLSTHLPASFLWLHSNVICLIDQAAYPDL